MTALLLSAQILLAVDSPTDVVDSYRVYVGLSPNSYFDYQEFPATNRFSVTVTNSRVYLACSALNSGGESDLSEEINVQIFGGWVQLAPSPTGPWTNYQSLTVPVELTEPARFVRIKLETQ